MISTPESLTWLSWIVELKLWVERCKEMRPDLIVSYFPLTLWPHYSNSFIDLPPPFLSSSSLLKQPRDHCLHNQPKIKIGSQIGSAVFYQGICIYPLTGRNSPFLFYNFYSCIILMYILITILWCHFSVDSFHHLYCLCQVFRFCNILLWWSIFIRP